MEWSGTLTVPQERTFTATASGIIGLLKKLDSQYWQAVGVKDPT
jgi:hypothetical protein